MPKVIFKFDEDKNLFNIWETCSLDVRYGVDFSKSLSPRIVGLCKNKKFEECEEKLKQYVKKPYRNELIYISVRAFNEAWSKINKEFFLRLSKVMKKPICSEEFTAYITTITRCPYHYNKNPYFFVNLFKSIPNILENSAHEIMHIQFHNTYWSDVEKQIGKEKTSDLKEALTVLLNVEFKDLWLVKDEGYTIHKELRDFIEREWKKHKDFDKLIDSCIEYLKKY
ncbi:hypothetical protein J4447_00995 [Candidatus Pacearchaeota archaeon]|nr:hypothetical protein [Candidatus Pacearchaeota archaeon]